MVIDDVGLAEALQEPDRRTVGVEAVVNENVSAVLDRGHVVLFDPSAREVHLRAGWFWDQEVFD